MTTAGRAPSILHGPRLPYHDGDRIETLVDLVAMRQPDDVAVRSRDGELTYAQLVEGADRAAMALVAAGVRPADVVAVRAQRSLDTVIALLGVLKAGAAYACAPADWPIARYRQLVDQTRARVCLSAVADEVLEGHVTLPIGALVGAAGPTAAGGSEPAAGGPARPAGTGTDPFCVFLTSGTTAVPKAALAPHRGVVRTAMDPAHRHDGRVVSLQNASAAWDVFAFELWVPLIRGGTCVLHDSPHLTGPQIRAQVAAGVTQLAMAATLFNALVDDDLDCFAGARLVFVGGERASADHLRRCLLRHPGVRLVNAYGPVENTISTTVWVASEEGLTDEVPIGAPVVNTSVYLLDEQHQVVPVGRTGELATSGDGVCLGYLGNPAENLRRFVTVDVEGEPVRVYLTGDLARIEDDGRLVFVGRRDNQLKIRGLRVEAEEIERLVESVPGVTRAVAVALPFDAPTKTRLAAFYLTSPGGPSGLVPSELVRKTLAAALPAGLVPDLVRSLPALPTLDNGKVDQRALAAHADAAPVRPDDAGATWIAEEAEAAGELERAVVTARNTAVDLLGYPIGPDDDIFDRGATSLTAIRISTRLGNVFAKRLEVAEVLAARTPRRIARAFAEAPALEGTATRESDPGPETGYEPTSVPFTVGSFWEASRQAGHLDEAIVPVIYRLRGPIDVDALSRAVDHVVARHEVLRARFSPGQRMPRVRILPAGEVTGLLSIQPASPDPQTALALAATWVMQPFDLGAAIPIRATYYPVSARESVLAIGVHHISFDGWSGQVFSHDLARAYDAAAAGRPLPADQPASYYRVCAEQREQYRDRQPLAVWSGARKVRDVPELSFPLGGQRPWSGPAAEITLRIDEDLLAEVGRAAAAVQGTVMAIFYAAYVQLLRSYTGSADPAVAVPVTGRFTEEAGQVIGCLASMLPLRLPAAARTPRELAVAAATELREAMRPPLIPLAAILPELPAGYHRHPLLQAYLLQEEMPPMDIGLGDARAELVRVPPGNALPEIALELWPHPAVGGVLRYRLDAIPTADAHRLAEQLVAGVRQIAMALSSDSKEDR